MRIIYVAKHGAQDNQDELAIAHGLYKLGHELQIFDERNPVGLEKAEGDFVLIHHWRNLARIAELKPPKVFWCFDLIDWPTDPSLAVRCNERKQWITKLTEICDLGFCTDGDWVNKDTTGKLIRLTQGMDERMAGRGTKSNAVIPLLFTGLANGGQQRMSHIQELLARYPDMKILDGKRRQHGRTLANTLADTIVTIAPDAPITDNYWSNRVYNTLGLGGFLIHPISQGLLEEYEHRDLIYYRDRKHCIAQIEFYSKRSDVREKMIEAGFNRTMAQHTYRHRCQKLISHVYFHLGVGGKP